MTGWQGNWLRDPFCRRQIVQAILILLVVAAVVLACAVSIAWGNRKIQDCLAEDKTREQCTEPHPGWDIYNL